MCVYRHGLEEVMVYKIIRKVILNKVLQLQAWTGRSHGL